MKSSTLQLNTRTPIPGIGPATMTIILSFRDPANYAIGDEDMGAALAVTTEHDGSLTTCESSLSPVHGTP